MVGVWAKLLFRFTFSSATLFVRSLDGDGLRIILDGYIMGRGHEQSINERRECIREIFKFA